MTLLLWPAYLTGMEVKLSAEQDAFMKHAIASGRVHDEQEAIQQALALWTERERRRLELLAAVDRAEASLAAGRGIVITPESMRELADEIKRRGRERLAAEQPPPR